MATSRLGLYTLSENQASAEITVNQTLARLDALAQGYVADWLDDPPASPNDYDTYLIATGGTGTEWEGYDNYIAYWYNTEWNFVLYKKGLTVYVAKIDGVAEDKYYHWNGTAWTLGPILTETPDVDKDSISGHLLFPEDKTYTLDLKASEAYTLNEFTAKTESGTCTANIKIEGVTVGSGISVTTNETSDTYSSGNTVSAGNTVTLVITSSSSPLDLLFTLAITKG